METSTAALWVCEKGLMMATAMVAMMDRQLVENLDEQLVGSKAADLVVQTADRKAGLMAIL